MLQVFKKASWLWNILSRKIRYCDVILKENFPPSEYRKAAFTKRVSEMLYFVIFVLVFIGYV